MPDELNEIPNQLNKGERIEKGQNPKAINESKLPDFKFTPPPPPPPPSNNENPSDGEKPK